MELEFRSPADGDWPAFVAAMQETFIETWPADSPERLRGFADRARPLAGFDGERLEATAGAYRHVMQVPGGSVPCTGITWITVSARQRRRGVLRELMRRLHEMGAAEGEPIAALYAAEGAIYNRFGFGVAARSIRVEIDSRELTALPVPPGRVIEVPREEVLLRFPAVFDQAVSGRPGVVARDSRWWERIILQAASPSPGWMEPRFVVYIDAAGRDRGIAALRLKGRERGLMFDGKCRVMDMHCVDAEAASATWRYAGSFDLVRTVSARMRPADEPVGLMLADLRQVRVRADEELWVHLSDPVAALHGRRYLSDGVLRFSVDDPTWPSASGTYELSVFDGAGSCARTTGAPDLDLGTAGLGAIYLGDTSPFQLAAAGRVVEHRPGAVADAHRIFHWAPAAWGPDMW